MNRLKISRYPGLWNHAPKARAGVIRRKSDNKVVYLCAHLRLRNSLHTVQFRIR